MSTSSSATTTIAVEDVKDWLDQDVLDPQGDKLGKLEEVFYDAETDTPAFAAVKSGVFGKRLTLVALAGATVGRAHLRVPVGKDQFKNAPSFDPDAELSTDDETSAYEYFGLEYRPLGPDVRRLAKH